MYPSEAGVQLGQALPCEAQTAFAVGSRHSGARGAL